MQAQVQPVQIVLVEDNPGDIELVRVGLEDARVANDIRVISDGAEAMEFINRGVDMPEIFLLDINLPKHSGFELLTAIRSNESTKAIPVIMLTSSEAEQDVVKSYRYQANCYVSKPIDFDRFIEAIRSLEEFWLSVVKLPS